MISIVLLLKIIFGICFILSWVYMYLSVRRTQRRLECLKEHCDERLTAMAEDMGRAWDDDAPENGELAETRRRALEAERRFTEGIASILNFNTSSECDVIAGNSIASDSIARDLTAGYSTTGKKGE